MNNTSISILPAIAALSFLVWNGSTILWLPCLGAVAAIFLLHLAINRLCCSKCKGCKKDLFLTKSILNWALFILLPAVAVSFAAIGAVQWSVLIATVPVGCLSDCVLHSSRRPDKKWKACFYNAEMLFPYVWVSILSMSGILPISTIMIFLSIPIAIGCGKILVNSFGNSTDVTSDLSLRTSHLQTGFTILLILAFIIDKFI